MSIEYEMYPDENDSLLLNVKTIKDNDEQICRYCKLNNPQWHKYALSCKHHMHTRCARKHFHEQNNSLHCPDCGQLDETDTGLYCCVCDNWGHYLEQCELNSDNNNNMHRKNTYHKKGFHDANESYDSLVRLLKENGLYEEPPTNRTGGRAGLEAIDFNIFREYNALKNLKGDDKYRNGRFLLLEYVIDCVKNDPDEGNYFVPEMRDKVVKAGQLLYEADGMAGMNDGLVWSFVPKRYQRDIDMMWDGIGDWQS